MARDRRARRLFGVRGFGRSVENLEYFPGGHGVKRERMLWQAGHEGAPGWEGESYEGREGGGIEPGVWVSSKKPGSTT